MKTALAKCAPFKVRFTSESFGYFTHKKSSTLWLKPLPVSEPTTAPTASEGAEGGKFIQPDTVHVPELINLQRTLEEAFPECDELSKISKLGFQPHLSLGQFATRDVEENALRLQQGWQDEEMEVKEVYLISRKDFNDPFHIRYTVRLGSA